MNDKKPVLYDEYGCPIEHQNATSDPDGISSGPTSSDHKNADGDHDKRGNTHKLQIAGLVVGCIACGAAVITAWIYYGQLREMIKATKATGEAIRISAGQSAIMERELADSEAQQRAVLKIE